MGLFIVLQEWVEAVGEKFSFPMFVFGPKYAVRKRLRMTKDSKILVNVLFVWCRVWVTIWWWLVWEQSSLSTLWPVICALSRLCGGSDRLYVHWGRMVHWFLIFNLFLCFCMCLGVRQGDRESFLCKLFDGAAVTMPENLLIQHTSLHLCRWWEWNIFIRWFK